MKAYVKPGLTAIIKQVAPKPRLELTQSQIDRLKTAGNILLAIVGIAGLVLVSTAAPNALQAFKFLAKKQGRERLPFKDRQRRLMRSFYYLKDKDYIRLRPKGMDLIIELTDKGQGRIRALKLDTLQIKKPLIWDRKFWQVAADIPVEYKKAAGALRDKLKQMGFYPLQRTLWFYPYDPRKEVESLAEEYKIDRFVTVMKIASLDYADRKVLEEHFRETGIVEF